jgi:hypothetical protein
MTAPAPEDPRVQAGYRILADLRDEITRADAKATVLVAVLGVSTGALGALRSDRGWDHSPPSAVAALLWWLGVSSLIAALFALLLAVVPRYRRSRWEAGRPLTYFADVRRAARAGELDTALSATGRAPAEALLIALAETSRIAARKHLWVRAGLIAFAAAAVLLPGALLVS